MQIEQMTVEHYFPLLELWKGFPGNTITGADSLDGFTLFIERNKSYCFTAIDNGLVVGSVMAGEDTRRGYIYHLAVAESMHHRGVGRKLMDSVESAMHQAGIEKLHLMIFSDNPAIEFYKKAGWHLRPDIEVMSKVLRGDKYMGSKLK